LVHWIGTEYRKVNGRSFKDICEYVKEWLRSYEMQSPAPTVDEHACPDCGKALKPIYLCTDCVEDTFNKRGIYSKATKHPEK
jgi:predicted RNA-binding Zn-ribbon protein involved in translation (DUF1610 family)